MHEVFRRILRRKEDIPPDHKKRSTILEKEIEACLLFLEESSTNPQQGEDSPNRIRLFHGNRYTVGRLAKGKGYFWQEQSGDLHVIKNELLPSEQGDDIIREIRTISFPYAFHIAQDAKIQP